MAVLLSWVLGERTTSQEVADVLRSLYALVKVKVKER